MAILDQSDDVVPGSRLAVIESAIAADLQRQAQSSQHRIDIAAMAHAVETAIAEHEPFTMDGGKEPDELNASNDG